MHGWSDHTAYKQIPFLPLPSCVTLGKSHNISVPQFSHLKNEDTTTPTSQGSRDNYLKFKCKILIKVRLANNEYSKKKAMISYDYCCYYDVIC